jgi:hypothetical protein
MSRSPPGGESERPPPIPPEPSHAHFVLKEHGLGLKRIARKVGAVAAIGVTFVAATAAGVWRFHKNYATQATVGDKGTSILDLTWKYRY